MAKRIFKKLATPANEAAKEAGQGRRPVMPRDRVTGRFIAGQEDTGYRNRQTGRMVNPGGAKQGSGTVPWKPGDLSRTEQEAAQMLDMLENGKLDN